MFGYVIINKGDMKFKEFDIYHSYYCGTKIRKRTKYRHFKRYKFIFASFLLVIDAPVIRPFSETGYICMFNHKFMYQ